ncbi:hypothetical protein SK128_007153 [Halocaridina rubra]|uniref:Uncharacterized protein n=1 Tax=Halocaridina rubra TaxID=373956 RepID=A0AAN9A750_HALRR
MQRSTTNPDVYRKARERDNKHKQQNTSELKGKKVFQRKTVLEHTFEPPTACGNNLFDISLYLLPVQALEHNRTNRVVSFPKKIKVLQQTLEFSTACGNNLYSISLYLLPVQATEHIRTNREVNVPKKKSTGINL